ncbi:MAG TPA: hypothetical protein DEQ53_11195 [Acinetobacter nosocomialis]|nr:hypothetical protein [Acinetobacter nosocomialis]
MNLQNTYARLIQNKHYEFVILNGEHKYVIMFGYSYYFLATA